MLAVAECFEDKLRRHGASTRRSGVHPDRACLLAPQHVACRSDGRRHSGRPHVRRRRRAACDGAHALGADGAPTLAGWRGGRGAAPCQNQAGTRCGQLGLRRLPSAPEHAFQAFPVGRLGRACRPHTGRVFRHRCAVPRRRKCCRRRAWRRACVAVRSRSSSAAPATLSPPRPRPRASACSASRGSDPPGASSQSW